MRIPYLYTEPCYEQEELRLMRAKNRDFSRKYPEYYCKRQMDFEHRYTISIGGKVYLMSHWLPGIDRIRKHYMEKIPRYVSFSMLNSLGKRLPKCLDYVVFNSDDRSKSEYTFISREAKFTLVLGIFRDVAKYDITYGDTDKIVGGHYDKYLY